MFFSDEPSSGIPRAGGALLPCPEQSALCVDDVIGTRCVASLPHAAFFSPPVARGASRFPLPGNFQESPFLFYRFYRQVISAFFLKGMR